MGREGYSKRYTLLRKLTSREETPIDASAMLL
jgi:hypothetical protein